jgi:uncharacterized protein YjbI with pentapeptide repeats
MPYTNFKHARRMIASFDGADLSSSVFLHSNLQGAQFRRNNLTTVNFSHANLQEIDFTNTDITESQIKSALSIQDARLPNQTAVRNPNLINNGKIECNNSLVGSWELQTGQVTRMASVIGSSCRFVLQFYDTRPVMLQCINLSKVWDPHLWPYSHAILNARMGNGASIHLNGMSSSRKILDQRNSSKFNWQSFCTFFCNYIGSTISNITMRLHEEMQMLEIRVEFPEHFNKTHLNNSWCNDIDLIIDYDTESKFLRGMSVMIF